MAINNYQKCKIKKNFILFYQNKNIWQFSDKEKEKILSFSKSYYNNSLNNLSFNSLKRKEKKNLHTFKTLTFSTFNGL